MCLVKPQCHKHFCDSQKNKVHAIHCNSFNNIKSRNKHKPRISFDSTDRCIVSLKFCSVLDTHNQECSLGSLLHNLLTGFLCEMDMHGCVLLHLSLHWLAGTTSGLIVNTLE